MGIGVVVEWEYKTKHHPIQNLRIIPKNYLKFILFKVESHGAPNL